MHRWMPALVLVSWTSSCGGGRSADSTLVIDDKPPPADAAVASSTPSPTTITAQLTPEQACARFETLASNGCDWTQRFPAEFREPSTCVASLTSWFADPKLQQSISCWALECDVATQCMIDANAGNTQRPPRKCGEDGTGPVLVDAAEWLARPGAQAKKFSELNTTEAKPVELCGVEAEVEWIARMKCNDGSNPYGSQEVANESRDAYLKKGGRCNSILDRYSVKCPEATYQVHVDRYICPQK